MDDELKPQDESLNSGTQPPPVSAIPQQQPIAAMDLATDMDPQSAIAAQGFNTIGQIAAPLIQQGIQAADTNLQNQYNTALAASQGDQQAGLELAKNSLGTAMGTLKIPKGQALKAAEEAKVLSANEKRAQLIEAAFGGDEAAKAELIKHKLLEEGQIEDINKLFNNADAFVEANEDALFKAKGNQWDKQRADWKANRNAKSAEDFKQRKFDIARKLGYLPKKKMADGGEVSPTQGVPEGLDDYVNSLQPGITPQAAPPMASEAPEGLDEYVNGIEHGTPIEQAKAGLEGVAQGIAGPLAPAAEMAFMQALGHNPEEIAKHIRGRAEANPITHGLGEAAGLVGSLVSGTGVGSLAVKGGELLTKGLEGASLASKIGSAAAKGFIENSLIQGSDELSKLVLHDPKQSAETALTDIGIAGVIGGALGGAIGSVEPLWNASLGSKAGQVIEDFKGRLNEHMANPDPVGNLHAEMQHYYGNMKESANEVFGPEGIKAKDIASAMPDMSEKVMNQASDIGANVQAQLDKMVEKPHVYPPRLTMKLEETLSKYSDAVAHSDVTPGEIFNAAQDMKRQLQDYAKFDKFVKPTDEAYDFVKISKDLAHGIRTSLEDTGVWGKAAQRQQVINKAFTEYLPALKDFERKFTSEIAGERVIDPTKVNTYMNQLGKPNAELKSQMLQNFLEASEKYKKVIHDSHINLGVESPVEHAPMNAMKRTLEESTTGEKLADLFVDKMLKGGSGSAIGAAVGSGLGHTTGVGAGWGALLGEKVFGPYFSSVLPAISKSLLSNKSSGTAAKAASDYAIAVMNGENLLNKASKNIFKAGALVLPKGAMPTPKDIIKLNKAVEAAQTDPNKSLNNSNKLSHYMPEHAAAMAQTAQVASDYLNSLKPNVAQRAPLDPKFKASTSQESVYNNAAQIVQQPLVVLEKIKQGSLTPSDIITMKTVYPALYTRITTKLTDAMVDHMTKGEVIPYKTRVGLSLFMGQPLDSTMSPMAIISAQPVANQPQQSPQMPHQGAKHSTTSLNKVSSSFRTPAQQRELEKQTK